jgi:hypothetical protein
MFTGIIHYYCTVRAGVHTYSKTALFDGFRVPSLSTTGYQYVLHPLSHSTFTSVAIECHLSLWFSRRV